MSDGLTEFLETSRQRSRESLPNFLGKLKSPFPAAADIQRSLLEASNYSLSTGGKRMRPILVYAAAGAAGGDAKGDALDNVAAAIELIHIYSLVHDDLPAMDDDDLRRGKPTLHKAFDVPTAILVGDGLQALAFEVIADAKELADSQKVKMTKVLASAAGFSGMVGGQHIDITSAGRTLDLSLLQAMHAMKTGAIIRAAVVMGGIAANATDEQLIALSRFGDHIGLAFQIADDILDVVGNEETIGKTPGKDEAYDKPTFVPLLGLEGAKEEANKSLKLALDALDSFGDSADQLRETARYIVERDR